MGPGVVVVVVFVVGGGGGESSEFALLFLPCCSILTVSSRVREQALTFYGTVSNFYS